MKLYQLQLVEKRMKLWSMRLVETKMKRCSIQLAGGEGEKKLIVKRKAAPLYVYSFVNTKRDPA